ncbi:MAG TPA: class I SAM-dependent methyltransferase [Cyclobacteriaceae bacterium]|nr:class I SAM-dependent methyltransferase [Cyclobacteriaceae bacterium]
MKSLSFIFILFSLTPAFSQTEDYLNVYTEAQWKARDAWQKAGEIIKKMKLDKASVVADIGCHEGYMTFKLSDVTSKVYAVDVDQSKLDKLTKHRDDRKVTTVVVVKGDYDDPKLPDNTLDAVVILDTYHEMDDHDEILRHIMAALKKGGRLIICEPIAGSRRDLARKDQERKHELGMKFALEDLAKAGFTIQEKTDPFVDREKVKGDKMWLIVATK